MSYKENNGGKKEKKILWDILHSGLLTPRFSWNSKWNQIDQ